jgi:hypothetical protein
MLFARTLPILRLAFYVALVLSASTVWIGTALRRQPWPIWMPRHVRFALLSTASELRAELLSVSPPLPSTEQLVWSIYINKPSGAIAVHRIIEGAFDPYDWLLFRLDEPQPQSVWDGLIIRYEIDSSSFRTNGREKIVARSVSIPYWSIILIGMIPLVIDIRRLVRRRSKHKSGLCPNCGYDLRASKDRCPECGLQRNSNSVNPS